MDSFFYFTSGFFTHTSLLLIFAVYMYVLHNFCPFIPSFLWLTSIQPSLCNCVREFLLLLCCVVFFLLLFMVQVPVVWLRRRTLYGCHVKCIVNSYASRHWSPCMQECVYAQTQPPNISWTHSTFSKLVGSRSISFTLFLCMCMVRCSLIGFRTRGHG